MPTDDENAELSLSLELTHAICAMSSPHAVRWTLAFLAILGVGSADRALAQRSVADSAMVLNQTGRWVEALTLSGAFLARPDVRPSDACAVRLSYAYAAIRLRRVALVDSALVSARHACSTHASAEVQLAQMEEEARGSFRPLDAVLVHPLYNEAFACSEHYGTDMALGDRFGTDCMVMRRDSIGLGTMAFYRRNGRENADWFSWGAAVLAPFDGTIVSVSQNPTVNKVGTLGKGRPGTVVIARTDGVHVVYAHLGTVRVAPGARVVAGEPIGTVGNNGLSYNPHTHVGAWRDSTALQIRFDLRVVQAR